ncbi:centrosomal protein of 295 kDa isoform X2 [Myxocyprinus asiaticus]|uniref:centrosomal protein of 295 kDa isoform X2 n=1 Tax=Myxocyprinus asiaticus TaxID=70543 RepID=UPI002222C296|nr:centrosomal protein of 295 kDa isoform X2 [Myxocyprinus asiaticus]
MNKVSRLKLSPNEETQLLREELDRRRKLRLQQVREQERYIAQQVRREVQERRMRELQMLADVLQQEWQTQQMEKLQTLEKHYENSLRSVGHAHRSAQENEPDLEAVAQKNVEQQERAAERHREALKELTARRHEQEQQRCRHIEARRKALVQEKKRAAKVASLPPPPPNPVESIVKKTPHPLKTAAAERFSVTRYHMTEIAVDTETDTEQHVDAHQAAEVEGQRLEELRREEARDRQEKLEKARLRGNHALRKEQNTQDRARLLCELERLQQADLLRRRQAVNSIPAQIYQPLFRQQELRDEQQRDLEIAFQDMYTEERKVKGDLVLQLVPEPLPSAASCDADLDVTLDPECTPAAETGDTPDTPETETPESSVGDPGRHALRRLLDRIRSQRDAASQRQRTATTTTSEEDAVPDVLSIETGSLSSQEHERAGEVDERTPSVTHADKGPEVSDEPIVAGTVLLPVEQAHVKPTSSETKTDMSQQTHEVSLLRQQQEQLALLEELEEKRRDLELRLRDTQLQRQTLEEAAQRHSGLQEVGALPEPTPEVTPDDLRTQRLHQYQQRLLEQNRRHKKCVEDARRRLEEYQHTLKLRYAIRSATVPQILQPSSVALETVCPLHLAKDTTPPDHRSGLAPTRDTSSTPPVTQSQLPFVSLPEPNGSDLTRPSVLSDGSPCDTRVFSASEPGQIPLPSPAVVLELLRSRQHQAPRVVVQSADTSRSMSVPSSDPTGSVLAVTEREQMSRQADRQELVRQHMRRQRDTLQALLRTGHVQDPVSSTSGVQSDQLTLNTLLKAIEESDGHTKPPITPHQSNDTTTTSLPNTNGSVYDQALVHRGRVKPPVSRPPTRLAFLRQMEQHELSAIQEVDTPINISLDADVSDSSSVSLPAVSSEASHSVSERSEVMGRVSRMSWREALLLHSADTQSLSSINHQQERFGMGLPSDPSVDPDYLSSTTISTGSYSTSEHEPNHTVTDVSLICMEPVSGIESSVCSPSPKSTSCHVTGNTSQEMRDSVQQIIDKYTRDLDVSLRTVGRHSGAAGSTSSGSPSWSSVLQQGVEVNQSSLHHGDAAEHRSSLNSAVDVSSTEHSGDFLPLQPLPDIDSSSSSSSRNLVRNDPSSRTQGWNEAVNRIMERLSDQLSIRRSYQVQVSTRNQLTVEPSSASSSMCSNQEQASNFSHLIGCLTNESSQSSSILSVRQNSIGPQSSVSQISNNSASPHPNNSNESNSSVAVHVLSQLIGIASNIDSSQVLDESSALADELEETTLQIHNTEVSTISSVGGGGPNLNLSPEGAYEMVPSETISPALQHPEGDRNAFSEAPHGDASDLFLPLPTEVTHNETMECSVGVHMPLQAEMCGTNMSVCAPDAFASDWLEPSDPSLTSFGLDASFQHLRAETLMESQPDLHISMEQLSLTHESLCQSDIVAPPTAMDFSCMPQEESPTLKPQSPSKEVSSEPDSVSTETPVHQSAVEENTLARLWERVQDGDVKGILEESTISFISLPESTLQDPDITITEECADRQTEENRPIKELEGESDYSVGKVSTATVEGNNQSKDPELPCPHAVMQLEFQSPTAQLQEALLRRQHHLAQRSARRAAEVKAKRAESGKITRVVQNVSKPTLTGCAVQKSETVCRLKSVVEVKICTPEQRRLDETEMYQRTERLYNQLEEVKQRKEFYGRQEAYAKNREKAKDFQRKTLEKLRAKQKR